jgi:hypothetical protein
MPQPIQRISFVVTTVSQDCVGFRKAAQLAKGLDAQLELLHAVERLLHRRASIRLADAA